MNKVFTKKADGLTATVKAEQGTHGKLKFNLSEKKGKFPLASMQTEVEFNAGKVVVKITKSTDGVNSIAYFDKFLSKLSNDLIFTAKGGGLFGVKFTLNYAVGGDVWKIKVVGLNTEEQESTLYISGAYVEPFIIGGGKTLLTIEKTEDSGKIDFTVKNGKPLKENLSAIGKQEELKDFVFPEYLAPFWKGDTVYDEPIILTANADSKGKIIGRPKAKLIFDPKEIISVKWYYHDSNGKVPVELDPKKDFTVKDGYIIAKGKITSKKYANYKGETFEFNLCGNSPFITNRQILGLDTFSGLNKESNSFDKSIKMLSTDGAFPSNDFYKDAKDGKIKDNYFLPFTEKTEIVQTQLSVTYKHNGKWTGKTPEFCGDTALKNSYKSLTEENRKEFNLLYVGDSITEGAHCSENFDIPPYTPHWTKAFSDGLAEYYGKEICVKNVAVGGWTSNEGVCGHNGVNGLKDRFDGKDGDKYIVGFKPDLVVIGFGMNDATNGNSVEFYSENIRSMIKTVREINGKADIILIGTMNPNIKAAWFYNEQQKYLPELYEIAKEEKGVSIVDMGSMQKELLLSGKRFIELTSNNINHTGDFTNRLYAVNLLSALIKI